MSKLLALKVQNLALIEEAELELSEELNVLTGETGAGKTMLAKALEALLGAKTTKGVVRPGADAAYIEATFSVPDSLGGGEEIEELLSDSDGEVVIARRIAAAGRSRCLVDGRTVSLETLRELSGRLIAFYGQHEGRKLMVEQAQVSMLDRSGDGKGTSLRQAYLLTRSQAISAERHVRELQEASQSAGRELELARFELQELNELSPQPGDEAQLMEELQSLSGAVEGQAACAQAHTMLEGESAASSQLLEASRILAGAGAKAAELQLRLEEAHTEVSDIAGELDLLGASWAADPHRQAEVESRLSDYSRLARKHFVTPDELPEVHRQLAETVSAADEGPQLLREAERAAEEALGRAQQAAAALSKWRKDQAPKLSKAVTGALQDLSMDGAKFEVELLPLDGEGTKGLGESGAEGVVFALQANPGLPQEPVSQVASGGEVSRLMLALVAEAGLEDQAVLVLDEPDTGIGGQTAHGVASRLEALSAQTQLLVISHLPQIAARADRHFRLVKSTDGKSTETVIDTLSEESEVIDELCRMSGHSPTDSDARAAAERLRQS